MDHIRVLVVDDHAVVREGIRMFLGIEPCLEVVGEAESGQEAIRQAKSLKPDVVLMDLLMPEGPGVEAIAEIKRCMPGVKVVVLTGFGDGPTVRSAIQAGADGYLLKDADGETLLNALQAVLQGDTPLHPRVARHLVADLTPYVDSLLTKREMEVLRLIAKGLSNKAVAQALNLCEGTVKVHVSNILDKLDVSSRTEASMKAIEMGLLSLSEVRRN